MCIGRYPHVFFFGAGMPTPSIGGASGGTSLGADESRGNGPSRQTSPPDHKIAARRFHDFLNLFWYESRATARTRTTPTTMPCQYDETRAMIRTLLMRAMKTTPINA